LIREHLAPVSGSYLRGLLRSCEVPLDPLVEGVRQSNLDELERTLLALWALYTTANDAGDRERAQLCRREVLTAKEHAKLAARSRRATPETRDQKLEMVSWMRVWLEDPSVFPSWLRLRRRVLAAEDPPEN